MFFLRLTMRVQFFLGGNGSIMLATTKTKGGVCVKKSIYHIQNKINTWF